MAYSSELERLSEIIDDVQVELRKLKRALGRVYDDELEGLIVRWIEMLEEVNTCLDEAESIMWDLAQEMKKERL